MLQAPCPSSSPDPLASRRPSPPLSLSLSRPHLLLSPLPSPLTSSLLISSSPPPPSLVPLPSPPSLPPLSEPYHALNGAATTDPLSCATEMATFHAVVAVLAWPPDQTLARPRLRLHCLMESMRGLCLLPFRPPSLVSPPLGLAFYTAIILGTAM